MFVDCVSVAVCRRRGSRSEAAKDGIAGTAPVRWTVVKFGAATAAATASAVTLDSLTASPSADERFRNSMHSSTASFLMESSRRHVTAPAAPARGEEFLLLLLRRTEALETAVSMMRRSTTSRMRSSSDTDAAGRAVDARHLPLVSRGMHAALAALAALLFMLYVRA